MSAQVPRTEGVFTRASSGLVRQVRTDDVMYYGWQQIALGYIIFIVFAWVFYPGSSMELATVIAIIGGVFIGGVYALFSSVYPRSGGEYVFLSRTLHPAVGFTLSFSFTFWQIFYFGINGAFLALFGLSPLFSTLGLQTDSEALTDIGTWFSDSWGIFLAGSAMILFFAFLQSRGAGLYFRTQRWASYVALVSVAATVITLIFSAAGVLDFQENFDELAGAGAYDQVIATAQAAGLDTSPAFSFTQTLFYMLWPAFSLWFAVASVSFSGEVKNVQRGQLLGITGAVVSMGILMAILMWLYRSSFGDEFMLASTAIAPEEFPLPASPFVNLYTGIAGDNWLLTIVNSVWVIAILFYVGATTLIYSTRAMLAWGIDGMAPERLADVSEKHHTPTTAIVVSFVLAEVWLFLYAFTDWLTVLVGFIPFALSFFCVSVAGIIFPFLRREVFENSPIAWRVGGFPVISLLGIVAALFTGFVLVRLFTDDNYGANKPFPVWMAVIVLVVGAAWFYAYRAFQLKRGVNVDRRFEEIPVE